LPYEAALSRPSRFLNRAAPESVRTLVRSLPASLLDRCLLIRDGAGGGSLRQAAADHADSRVNLRRGDAEAILEEGGTMKVTVIGAAGSVGAPAAFYVGTQGLVDEMVLIDVRPNVVQQHAMDLSTALSALDVRVMAGTYEDMGGSDLVINAAGVPQGLIADRMEMLPKNIPLVRDVALAVKQYCPAAFLITATNPIDPLNYATWKAGSFDRHQVIGYSINDSSRFREMVARAKGVKVGQVEATVIGEHGSTQVPLFSSVRVDGRPVSFSEEEKQAIRAEIPSILKRYEELQAGRTAGWTSAIGLATITRALLQDTGEVFPCSVVLDGEYGCRGISMSVPVRLGGGGVQEILEWELAPDEQAGLAVTAGVLRAAAQIVDENLS
jgi:malate dehydrogenase